MLSYLLLALLLLLLLAGVINPQLTFSKVDLALAKIHLPITVGMGLCLCICWADSIEGEAALHFEHLQGHTADAIVNTVLSACCIEPLPVHAVHGGWLQDLRQIALTV